MKNESTEKVEVTFDVSEVTNDFLLHIKEVMEGIANIYNAIQEADIDFNKPLPTEDLPLFIHDNKKPRSKDEKKEFVTDWIVEKGFEEMIVGVGKILKKAYNFSSYYRLVKEREMVYIEEVHDELRLIHKNSETLHFPVLIKDIEKNIGVRLPYAKEVLSINKVRSCFVHRNGVVGVKDLNDSENKVLRLEWVTNKTYVEVDGERKPMSYDLRKEPKIVHNMEVHRENMVEVYGLDQKIKIDIDQLNGIAHTCSFFAYGLREAINKGLGV